ncbi:MAG: hypothetical protein J7K20_02565 [Thermodesulfobacterium sp.]|nr:hypothetical protein [Thermodesulfobacterium sp.]
MFIDIMEARDRIFRWIEDYNIKRLHSRLRYFTPMKVWEEGIKKEANDPNIKSVKFGNISLLCTIIFSFIWFLLN